MKAFKRLWAKVPVSAKTRLEQACISGIVSFSVLATGAGVQTCQMIRQMINDMLSGGGVA